MKSNLQPVLASVLFMLMMARAVSAADVHQSTSAPANGRFEIVQSELSAKWTFRLDRYTGQVAQLVRTATDGNQWEAMNVIGLPPLQSASAPRFQIFESGLAAKFSFLIDTATGQSWVLSSQTNKDGSQITFWAPFEQ